MRTRMMMFLMLLPVLVKAQRHELGVLAGIKSDGGVTASAAYYLKLASFQLGPLLELSQVETKLVTVPAVNENYNAISAGINLNYQYKFPRGYIYPGITARYRIGTGILEYRGIDVGLQAGVVFKLVKFLSLNAETGVRADNIKVYNIMGDELGQTSDVRVPILVGLRFAL